MTRVLIPEVLLLLFPIVIPPSEALPITGQLGAIDFRGFGVWVGLAAQVHGPSLGNLDHGCRSGEVVILDQTWSDPDGGSQQLARARRHPTVAGF